MSNSLLSSLVTQARGGGSSAYNEMVDWHRDTYGAPGQRQVSPGVFEDYGTNSTPNFAEMSTLERLRFQLSQTTDANLRAQLQAQIRQEELLEEQKLGQQAQGFLSNKLQMEQGRRLGYAERQAGTGSARQSARTRMSV